MKNFDKAVIAVLGWGFLLGALAGVAHCKDKWQVGYFRTIKSQNYDQAVKTVGNGYHVTVGTDGYTCVGGDDHNATDCASDKSWAQAAMSGRAIGFADGTGYACELGSCPEWVSNIEAASYGLDGPFLYRMDRHGMMEIKNTFTKFIAPVLDGKKHDLRVTAH